MDFAQNICEKSPKMWVNELCVKQGVMAKYNVREAIPGQSPPTFICTCTIAYRDKTLKTENMGKTKKEAEQKAAYDMLFKRLEMTPAKLLQISNASKKSSVPAGPIANGDDEEEAVSDTDEMDLNNSKDPIGELIAICDQHELPDPEYNEVKIEGPPHKRIFTVSCTVKDTTCRGRRLKKQTAKKLAAFRVVRELKKQGLTFTPFTPESTGRDQVNGGSTGNGINFEAIARQVNNISLGTGDAVDCDDGNFFEKQQEFLFNLGGRLYCNKNSENCLEYAANYSHVFQHLKKSETLDDVFADADITQSVKKYGGPIRLLQKIADEIGIRMKMYTIGKLNTGQECTFLELRFPFNFKYNIPKKLCVNGVGVTAADAKNDAANEALKLIQLHLFSQGTTNGVK